jgi:hypothetical protein
MMLCTLTDLKTYLGITTNESDSVLEMLIKQNSAMIENYLNYSLARKINEAEVHSVNNEQLLLLDNQPIQSVSAVTIGGTAIDDFKVIPKYSSVGMLYRGLGWCGEYYTRGMTYDPVAGVYEIEVSYISGYYLPNDEGYSEGASDSLPYDIMTACIIACAEEWNVKVNNAEGIKSYSEGGQSTTFLDNGTMADSGLSRKVCSMLESYKRQAVA